MKTFKSVEFMTAEDKRKTFKNWITFLNFLCSDKWEKWNEEQTGSDYGMEAPRVFSKRLYQHLSLHCGFIAHYNIHGFYSEYFSGNEDDLIKFFDCIDSWGDYADLGGAMLEAFEERKTRLFAKAEEETEDKFELIKELVKRGETDQDIKKRLVNLIN